MYVFTTRAANTQDNTERQKIQD